MEPKEFVEKVSNPCLRSVADQFIRPEAVDFVSGQPQFPVGRHHIGIDLQRGFAVFGKVMLTVDLDDNPLTARKEEEKIHALARER
jgi:hypothetical protein